MSKEFLKVRKGLSFQELASAPTDPQNGDIYYSSSQNKLMLYVNSSWQPVAVGSASGGVPKNTLINRTSTLLPSGPNAIIDGVVLQENDTVLFTNLSSGNNLTYTATGVGTSIIWAPNPAYSDGEVITIVKGVEYKGTLFIFVNGIWKSFDENLKYLMDSMAFVDLADTTKKLKFDVNGSTGTTTTITSMSTANRNLMLPDQNDSLATVTDTKKAALKYSIIFGA